MFRKKWKSQNKGVSVRNFGSFFEVDGHRHLSSIPIVLNWFQLLYVLLQTGEFHNSKGRGPKKITFLVVFYY